MHLSDFYLDQTINIFLWSIQGCFIIVYNVKHVNGPRVPSVNTKAPLCVGEAILFIISISVTFLDRSSFEGSVCVALISFVRLARQMLCLIKFFLLWLCQLNWSSNDKLLSNIVLYHWFSVEPVYPKFRFFCAFQLIHCTVSISEA